MPNIGIVLPPETVAVVREVQGLPQEKPNEQKAIEKALYIMNLQDDETVQTFATHEGNHWNVDVVHGRSVWTVQIADSVLEK